MEYLKIIVNLLSTDDQDFNIRFNYEESRAKQMEEDEMIEKQRIMRR